MTRPLGPDGYPKSFMEQVNDAMAPATRAYSEPELLSIMSQPGEIKETEAVFTVRIRCKRKAQPFCPWCGGVPHAPTKEKCEEYRRSTLSSTGRAADS